MKLVKLNDNTFVVKQDHKTLLGKKEDAVMYLIENLEVLPSEIAAALNDFEVNGNNVADFGLNNTFIFGKQVDLNVADPLEVIKRMR